MVLDGSINEKKKQRDEDSARGRIQVVQQLPRDVSCGTIALSTSSLLVSDGSHSNRSSDARTMADSQTNKTGESNACMDNSAPDNCRSGTQESKQKMGSPKQLGGRNKTTQWSSGEKTNEKEKLCHFDQKRAGEVPTKQVNGCGKKKGQKNVHESVSEHFAPENEGKRTIDIGTGPPYSKHLHELMHGALKKDDQDLDLESSNMQSGQSQDKKQKMAIPPTQIAQSSSIRICGVDGNRPRDGTMLSGDRKMLQEEEYDNCDDPHSMGKNSTCDLGIHFSPQSNVLSGTTGNKERKNRQKGSEGMLIEAAQWQTSYRHDKTMTSSSLLSRINKNSPKFASSVGGNALGNQQATSGSKMVRNENKYRGIRLHISSTSSEQGLNARAPISSRGDVLQQWMKIKGARRKSKEAKESYLEHQSLHSTVQSEADTLEKHQLSTAPKSRERPNLPHNPAFDASQYTDEQLDAAVEKSKLICQLAEERENKRVNEIAARIFLSDDEDERHPNKVQCQHCNKWLTPGGLDFHLKNRTCQKVSRGARKNKEAPTSSSPITLSKTLYKDDNSDLSEHSSMSDGDSSFETGSHEASDGASDGDAVCRNCLCAFDNSELLASHLSKHPFCRDVHNELNIINFEQSSQESHSRKRKHIDDSLPGSDK